MGALLHNQLSGAGFFLSFGVLIGIVAIFRWGTIGSIVFVVSGLPMVFLGQNPWYENILLYPVANVVIILAALMLVKVGQDKVLKEPLLLFIYVTIAFIIVAVSKGFIVFILGDSFLGSSIMYFLSQLFNLFMTYIVLVLIKKRQGLLTDMTLYFERVNLEEIE
jgi:hypothetical protein